jgi:hypothetical protein
MSPESVVRSVLEAGEPVQAFAWFLFALIVVAASVGASVAVGALVAEMAKPPADPQSDAGPDFRGPRASLGDAVPFVFGTVQIRSPIVLWAGPVTDGLPYPNASVLVAYDGESFVPSDVPGLQYWSSLDLLLCERVHTDGVQVGTITLRKIWYGKNLLWDGSGFATPVTTSNNLLRHDPNGNDDSLIPGGGTPDTSGDGWDITGDGWWWGGVVKRGPPYAAGYGVLLGNYSKVANSGIWAQYLGLEKISFYVGSGAESQDPLGELIYSTDWNTDDQYLYPRYHKFARLVFHEFVWGNEPNIEDISAEVTVSCPAPEIGDVAGIMPNGLDVNPVSVLYTLLTHPDFCGGPKLPGVDVEAFTEAYQVVHSERLGMSYRLQAPIKAQQLVETILGHIDGLVFRDPESGLINLRLNRLVQTAIPKFTEAHVLELSDISKSTWQATFSQARVTFEMRGGSGNEMGARNVAVAKDPGLAINSGLIETLDDDLPTVYDADVANTIAARRLSNANTPLIKWQAKYNRRVSDDASETSMLDLRPGDMFTQDYAPLGLANLRLRVVSVDPGKLDDNAITITAIQDLYQAQAIIAPPGQPDGYTVIDPPDEVEIETYRAWTAPYYIARTGLGSDARRTLTTAPLYDITSDEDGREFAVNYDRFMMLAKAPYAGATRLQWSVVNFDTGASAYTAQVPYTEAGELVGAMIYAVNNDSGEITSLEVGGLTEAGASLLTSAPDKLLLIDDEIFLVSAVNATLSEDGTSVSWSTAQRQMLDSPENNSEHEDGATVWILDHSSASWLNDRLAPPMQSSVEEFWDRDAEDPTDGYFNDYQTLTGHYTHRVRNIDSSKINVEASSSNYLQDRANRTLPIREVDFASDVVSLSSASTSFAYDFSQLTSVTRLFQQREIGHLGQTGDDSFELLLPKHQESTDKNSAESITGILSDAREDDGHHIVKLELWYEYLTGPLSGTIRTFAAVADADACSFTIEATAEATTRNILCYLRVCYAPYNLGDAGYVPIRRSVARTFTITLFRT